MSATPRIGILGAGGRMGRILIQAVKEAGYQLAAAVERPESSLIGADAGELAGVGSLGVKVVGHLEEVVKDCDVVIDFTAPAATVNHLKICRENGVAIVIGTTGMNDEQKAYLEESAKETPVVYAANYSVGVNVSIKLLELASKVFGDTVDIEVIEAHHRHKVDAPSGTALMMGEAIAGALGRDLKKMRYITVKGIRVHVNVKALVFRPFVAVISSVNILRCLLAKANALKLRIKPPTV